MTTAPSDAPTGGPGPGDQVPTGQAPTWKRRSARHTFASTVLVLESFVVLFATLAAFALDVASPGAVWAGGGALSVVLVLVAGMLRRPAGYLAGSVMQGLVLAGGLALLAAPVPSARFAAGTSLVIGIVFVGLWVVALRLGGRIDREKADWDAAHPGNSAAAVIGRGA